MLREDRPGVVTMPVPVVVLSAGSLLPVAQQVQRHSVELAQPDQSGKFKFIKTVADLSFIMCCLKKN